MNAARRFTVLTTGEVEPGFDETQVALDFVSLVHTTHERAIAFVHTEQQLVIDVDEERALAYQKKLAGIGMSIRVIDSSELAAANEDEAQQQPFDSGELSLQLTSEPTDSDETGSNEESFGEINLISELSKKPSPSSLDDELNSEIDESQQQALDSGELSLQPDAEPEFIGEKNHIASRIGEPSPGSLDDELNLEIDDLIDGNASSLDDAANQDFSDLDALDDAPTQDFSDLDALDDAPTQDFSDLGALDDAPTQDFSDLNAPDDAPVQDFSDLNAPDDAPVQDFSDLNVLDDAPAQDFADLNTLDDAPAQDFSDLNAPDDAPAQDFSDLNAPDDAPAQDFSDLNTLDDAPAQDFSDLNTPEDAPTQDFSDLSALADEPTQELFDLNALADQASKSISTHGEPVDVSSQDLSDLDSETNDTFTAPQADASQSVSFDAKNDEEAIINNIRQEGKKFNANRNPVSVFSFRNRTLRLCVLAIIAAAVAAYAFITSPINPLSVSPHNVPNYSYSNTASEDMNRLMDVSGIQADIDLFLTSVPNQFRAYLSDSKSKGLTLSDSQHQNVMALVPNAFNKEALHNTVASWLQKNTFEDDIPNLIAAFENPKIQAFLELKLAKNRISDSQGFLTFQESLAIDPLDGTRSRALTRLLDALILDTVDYEIGGDLQRAFITTRGAAGTDNDSAESKEQIRNEIKSMRDSLVYARPDIRRDALQELSWQLEEFSVEDINEIRGALDDSSMRELNRQMVKGYEEYLKQSTLWLQHEL